MKTIGYLRVSAKSQVGRGGLDRQAEAINRYAKKNKITIDQIYREQVSGTKSENERPQFMMMIGDILSNSNGENVKGIIIIENLSRLAREYRIQEQLLYYLASKGIDVISAETAENITSAMKDDPMKKAMIQMQGVFSELEKSSLLYRMRKGQEKKKAETGRCAGAYGYGALHPKFPDQAAREKEILRFIVHARSPQKSHVRGKVRWSKPLMSFQEITNHLNAKGPEYQPKRARKNGNRWTVGTVYHAYHCARTLGIQ
jgi:DNA invertase Pin-like site-specific DNA recombinase